MALKARMVEPEIGELAMDRTSRWNAETSQGTQPTADLAGGPEQAPEFVLTRDDARHATHLRETTASAYHYAASSAALPVIGPNAYAAYLHALLEEAGSPTDPIERQLIEQLTLAHHAVGRMYCKAAEAETPEAAGIYLAAAARLMGEHRRSALALKAYRANMTSTQVTVVQSQDGEVTGSRVAILAEEVERGVRGCEPISRPQEVSPGRPPTRRLILAGSPPVEGTGKSGSASARTALSGWPRPPWRGAPGSTPPVHARLKERHARRTTAGSDRTARSRSGSRRPRWPRRPP